MDGIDPETLLEWLQTGAGDERDLQLMALEQLCMLLLMSDNIDRCFESCPPRTFLPALCKISLDETAPDNVLEVTARAITYYLDVSNEWNGAIKAICNRLAAAEMNDRSSKDLAEQCVKLLEHVCQRETLAVYDAGGIHAMLTLVRQNGNQIHKDTMYSAMSVVTRLCGKMEPNEPALAQCAESLGALLAHEDAKVSESALRCFAALTDRFIRKSMDPIELARHTGKQKDICNLVDHLLASLCATEPPSAVFTSIVLSILSNLCRGSAEVTQQVLSNNLLIAALFAVLTGKNDRCWKEFVAEELPGIGNGISRLGDGRTGKASHRCDPPKDTQALVEAIESGTVDVNYTDDVGQSLLNWAAAFGSIEMVSFFVRLYRPYVNKGSKSSSLHYAACFGRPDVVKMLLQRGANPDLREMKMGKRRWTRLVNEATKITLKWRQSLKVRQYTCMPRTKPLTSCTNLYPFLEIFQKSLNNSVRRSSLLLLRKSVQHMTSDDLRAAAEHLAFESKSEDACSFSDSLVGVLVNVLEQEEDVDGLRTKCFCSTSSTPSVALESDIERTTPGISERDRGQMLNVPISVDEDFSTMQTPPPTVEVVGTPSEAIIAVLYRWKEWRIVRDAETLYIWADPIALEFPQNSNGWIRYCRTVNCGSCTVMDIRRSLDRVKLTRRNHLLRNGDEQRQLAATQCPHRFFKS
ncbi:unnamed protein product, partial [Mesorhabditis belari]|uniref:E3 ubiquitin-protein ligase n=1 Tax=Mesorhabditis belari TaxID=2138241 RepID=A0AAF3FRC6_9BILA